MSRRWIAGAAVLLLPAAGACRDAGASAGFTGSIDTLAGGVVHVRNPATGMWKPGEEWTLAIARQKWFTEQGGKVDPSRIPGRKPAFGGVVVDDEGRSLGRVVSPERLPLTGQVLIRGDRLYSVVRDEMDIPYVVRYRIQGRKA